MCSFKVFECFHLLHDHTATSWSTSGEPNQSILLWKRVNTGARQMKNADISGAVRTGSFLFWLLLPSACAPTYIGQRKTTRSHLLNTAAMQLRCEKNGER